MTFDTLNAPGRPAAIIADFETAAGSGDLPVAEAMVRSLIRATVDAIRGRDIDALRNLGEAVEDFTGSRIEVIEKRAPRLAARVEHLLPIISEAMD
ncbi:MAG: hypothetical protein ACREQ5_35450, partial [Candidatus Dormibacteria bacterium]